MRTFKSVLIMFLGLAAGCGDDNKVPVDGSQPIDAPSPDACVPSTLHLMALTSGDITVDSTQREVFVDMSPPLDKSILLFSVRENESSPRYGAFYCELVAANATAMTPAGLACRHESFGSDNTPAVPVTIHWQVATFDRGVTVQRALSDTSTTSPLAVTLSPAVDPATSFVIMNGTFAGGGGWGNNDFTRATLTNGTTLTLEQNAAGAVVPWQVVTMVGAKVQRGTTSLAATDTMKSVPLTNVESGSFALATYTADNPASTVAGALMVQTTLTGTSLELKRDIAGVAMEVGYEVIHLPFPAHLFTTDFAAGEASKTQAIAGLTTNSVAFSSSQSILGQSGGRTAFADAVELDRLGEAAFTFTTSAGSVKVERTAMTAAASVSWNALDLSTPACQ